MSISIIPPKKEILLKDLETNMIIRIEKGYRGCQFYRVVTQKDLAIAIPLQGSNWTHDIISGCSNGQACIGSFKVLEIVGTLEYST